MSDRMAGKPNMRNLSRASRRWLVVAMYLCLIVLTAVLAFGQDFWLAVLAFGFLICFGFLHNRLVRPIAKEVGSKASDLDERQIMVRDRAHYRAYQILAALFMTSAFYMAVNAIFLGERLPVPTTSQHFVALVVSLSILIASLPSSVVAWEEPGSLSEE